MTSIIIKPILLILFMVFFFKNIFGQNKSTDIADNKNGRNSEEMIRIQKLIDKTFPFIEDRLKKYGEFYPVGSVIKSNDSITMVGTYDGDEYPLSQMVIDNLKNGFKQHKQDYKTIVIFYDVKVPDPQTNTKTDAVAVFTEDEESKNAYIFYYPYKISSTQELIYSKSFGGKTDKEIFIDK